MEGTGLDGAGPGLAPELNLVILQDESNPSSHSETFDNNSDLISPKGWRGQNSVKRILAPSQLGWTNDPRDHR